MISSLIALIAIYEDRMGDTPFYLDAPVTGVILWIENFHRELYQLPGFCVYLRPSYECDSPNLKEHSDGGTV